MRQKRKIVSVLAAGLVAGSLFATPIPSLGVAEAAENSDKILNTKSRTTRTYNNVQSTELSNLQLDPSYGEGVKL